MEYGFLAIITILVYLIMEKIYLVALYLYWIQILAQRIYMSSPNY